MLNIDESEFSIPLRIQSNITRQTNITYDYLNEFHLLRSMPLIVIDSHKPWDNSSRILEPIESLLLSKPCNLQTSLLFQPQTYRKSDNTHAILFDLLTDMWNSSAWMLHFRNCELNTVKQTRLMVDKPYFYAPHLEMPYTTWILLSRGYRSGSAKFLKLSGLIIVMQLTESLQISLRAKGECRDICVDLNFQLHQGESLVFLTSLWNMVYVPNSTNNTAISFITETYHN
ncbi:uncharacterized protein LOC129759804 [Uranotaenia lowii]|uniref:uncharacterized protein LOC129759804 n=1 Tax=Uranotaenia lowii TaxID=190385 RepID=UPI00247A19BF|nr:uncharacterized protein LOC129759804 [Uranotaenia lowii]